MLDVMPVFTRAGCNSGSCHGAARGKDGFRISLVGFDPRGDHFRITREQAKRRINLAVPTDSLLLEKACGAVQHTGGKRIDTDSKYYDFIKRWLADGAPSDADNAPSVSSLAIYPPAAVIQGEGSTQQFRSVASYSDGTTRDVTDLAKFTSNNDSSAPIDGERLGNRGGPRRILRYGSVRCSHCRQPSVDTAQRFTVHAFRGEFPRIISTS